MNFCKDCQHCARGHISLDDCDFVELVCIIRPCKTKPNLVDGSDVLIDNIDYLAWFRGRLFWQCIHSRTTDDCEHFAEKQREVVRWYQFWKWFR